MGALFGRGTIGRGRNGVSVAAAERHADPGALVQIVEQRLGHDFGEPDRGGKPEGTCEDEGKHHGVDGAGEAPGESLCDAAYVTVHMGPFRDWVTATPGRDCGRTTVAPEGMAFSGKPGFAQKASPADGKPVPSVSVRACSL